MARENQFTREGLERLTIELEDLKGRERLRIAETIREAKSHGDLKENAAYHEAKLNQTRLEKRISDLERAMQSARIIEVSTGSGAGLGSKITLEDLDFGDTFDVSLVGDFEADPDKGLVSVGSPFGEAISGKEAGAEIEVKAPAGIQRYRILAIS